jgi:hypothetical protein
MLAIYAAAASVPALLLLYFLKLRRRTLPISSTFLWRRAVQDLQVNAPFQRLRRNLLLLLQLLALAAALVALAGPMLLHQAGPPKRYVLLIDRSASMNATDAGATPNSSRLDAAKAQAKEFLARLRSRASLSFQDASDQAMVVAFDEHTRVMSGFTSDKGQLGAAIEAVTPSDGRSLLAEAVSVAQAFAQSPGKDANNRSAETAAQLELFSDGKVQEGQAVTLAASQPAGAALALNLAPGELNFHRIGQDSRNVAVVAMQARRSYEQPREAEVFTTLANYGPEAVTCDVQLSLDSAIKAVQSVRIPPRANNGQAGTLSVSFALTSSEGGMLEVRCLPRPQDNRLSSDDAAWALLAPPKSLSALLVSSGNAPLESALKACPLARLDVRTPAEFDANQAAMEAQMPYDVVILDRHAPAKLPRGRYLVFGQPPPASSAKAGPELKNQQVVDWRGRHPVLQYVNLTNLFAAKCWKLELPAGGAVLAEFGSGPALALLSREGSVFLLAPFDCLETNWPFEPGFVLFCYNATSFLGADARQEQAGALRVNEPLSLEHLPAGTQAQLSGPGIAPQTLMASPSGAIRFGGANRAGVYQMDVKGRPAARFPVNLLDAQESDIAPADELALAGQKIAAQAGSGKANLELWPWLALLGLGLILLEWIIYNRRVRV